MTGSAPQPPTALRIERTYNASARTVFDAWTNPEVVRRWWHAGTDWENAVGEVDLRLGGAIRIVMRTPAGEEYGGGGEYTEIEPPARLAFTWAWDDEPERRSLIELDFSEHDGATTVVLTHSGLEGEQSVAGHTEGWQQALDNLGAALGA